MADIFKIPVTSDEASYKILCDLDGASYVLRFDWNGRSQRWVMGVYDAEENPLAVGLVLNVNYPLIGPYQIGGLPPGEMILFDTSEKKQECGRNDLGNRCELIYQNSL